MTLKLNEALKYFKRVILGATDRVWHYAKPRNEKFPYAVWNEVSEEDSMYADNKKKHQPILVILDYYTQIEFDPVIDAIQNALNEAPGIAFELTDIQYEEDAAVIHYGWRVVIGDGESDNFRI